MERCDVFLVRLAEVARIAAQLFEHRAISHVLTSLQKPLPTNPNNYVSPTP